MATPTTFDLRRGDERGRTDLGWLRSRHSFSFGDYHDPDRMAFRSLRVLNDDVVQPGAGFGEHGHRDMEIMSWVLDGALAHGDSTGTRGEVRPGDLQVMTAGRGIRHREMNASRTDPVHFLQIWIEPAEPGLEPAYGQRSFPAGGRRNRWQLVASPDGRDGAMRIHQDAELRIADLATGQRLAAGVASGRAGYVHVATGRVRIGDDVVLAAGDAITFASDAVASFEADETSQLLFFDLA